MLNHAAEKLESILMPEFLPFPKWGDPAWQTLPQKTREALIRDAEALQAQEWPVLNASLYMDFVRNGNRKRYEAVYFARRRRVFLLTMGECAEGKGRFLDNIINGVWAICEETSWVVPAHNNQYIKAKNGGYVMETEVDSMNALPDVDIPYIDLFCSETGSMLAWVYYFLGDALARESPLIPLRILRELRRRIILPYLTADDMCWMGLDGRKVNNWNPWINSNVIAVLLIAEADPSRRLAGLKKAARSAQKFLDSYEPDGGCDEGPSYYQAAGAALLDALDLFYTATNGRFNVYDQPLIGNMAEYIRHVHIHDHSFVNFADSPNQLSIDYAHLLIQAGKRAGREQLVAFARWAIQNGLSRSLSHGNCWHLFRQLNSLFAPPEPLAVYTPESGHFFSGIQVAVARSEGGLFFAAKGGHNDESHNHNDVGNYILYAHGEPCVIDAGVGTYSRKTFSDRRYEIWSMQSGYHNTAIFNGCDQRNGRQYAAHCVEYADNGAVMRFSFCMERAWGEEADLEECRRQFTVDRARNIVTVCDHVRMKEIREPARLPIMCCHQPILSEGVADLGGLTLRYDPRQFTASVEAKGLNDPENPITDWPADTLYRLILTRREALKDDAWTLTYTLA